MRGNERNRGTQRHSEEASKAWRGEGRRAAESNGEREEEEERRREGSEDEEERKEPFSHRDFPGLFSFSSLSALNSESSEIVNNKR